jgi:hypothetical protein
VSGTSHIILTTWSSDRSEIHRIDVLRGPRTVRRANICNKSGWVPKVDLVVQLAEPKRDDVVIIQHYRGDKAWGKPIKMPSQNITPRRGIYTAKNDRDVAFSCGARAL